MAAFVVRRLAQSALVLLGIATGSFFLLKLVPGTVANAILGLHATPTAVAAVNKRLGLAKPLLDQYWHFVSSAVELKLGYSVTQQASVSGLIGQRLGATLFLAAYASVISIIIAVPLGVISARRRNRMADHAVRLFTMTTFTMPAFWLALILLWLLSVKAHVFPVSGYGSGFIGHIQYLALPAITVSLGMAPLVVRTLRADLVQTMSSEFVEAARARGFTEVRIFWRYTLRNSLVASVTVIGVNVAYVLGVAVVIEQVFVVPGIGALLLAAVQGRDIPLVQGLVLVVGAIVVGINTITDIAYALIDPRVRLNGTSR